MNQIDKILDLYDELGGVARRRAAVGAGADLALDKPAGPEHFCSSCAFRGALPSFSRCDACVMTAQGQKLNWTNPHTLEVPHNPGLNAKPEPEPEPDTPVVPVFDPDVFLMMAPFSTSLAEARAQARAQAQLQNQRAQLAREQAFAALQSTPEPEPAPADEPDTPVVPVFDDEVLL